MGNAFEHLERLGIEVNVGLGYFDGNEEQYLKIVKEFQYSAKARKEKIEKAMQEQDWENYVIAVHTLKSTARNIGAVKISELAAGLEQHGKQREYGEVCLKTPELLNGFTALYTNLESCCGDKDGRKAPVEYNEVDSLLDKLILAAEDFDFMLAEELIENINGYDFQGQAAWKMQEITAAMRQLDYYGCAELAKELKNESGIL